jgi:hypothetical protein
MRITAMQYERKYHPDPRFDSEKIWVSADLESFDKDKVDMIMKMLQEFVERHRTIKQSVPEIRIRDRPQSAPVAGVQS